MKKILLLYPSIHYVLKAEKILKQNGLAVDLVPVPKEIKGDCGMALEIESSTSSRVLKILKDVNLLPEKIYEKVTRGNRSFYYGKDDSYQQEG